MNRDDIISFIIIACCVFHICLDGIDDIGIDDFIAEGHENDDDAPNNVPNNRICEEDIVNDTDGEAKRNYLSYTCILRFYTL